jgi:putative FmdB family regulatory protein
MPIYEYECSACGEEFEAMQKFSDKPLNSCTLCSAKGKVHRKLSAPSFHLQGGGWYSQGYSGKAAEGAKAGTASKAGGKSDTPAGASGSKAEGKTASGSTEGKAAPAPKKESAPATV